MPQTKPQPNHRSATRGRRLADGLRGRGTASRRARRGRCLRVDARPELRAEPDWDRFAWALLQYVRVQREEAERSHREEDAR